MELILYVIFYGVIALSTFGFFAFVHCTYLEYKSNKECGEMNEL